MDRRQKRILRDFAIVIVITAIAVVAMINFKDWVNHSEAMRAMEHLSRIITQYRQNHGSVPPKSAVDSIRENLHSRVRLGNLRYRGQWIKLESTDDEILAYTERIYHSLLNDGYIVLRLDGRVEWMDKQEFESLLARQQSPIEKQMTED